MNNPEYLQWLKNAHEEAKQNDQEEQNYIRALDTLLKYFEQFKPVLRSLEYEGYLVSNEIKDMVMRVRASTQYSYEHVSKQNKQVFQELRSKVESYTTPQLSLVIEHPHTEAAVLLTLTAVAATPITQNGKQSAPEDSIHILWKYDTDNVATAMQEIATSPNEAQVLIEAILNGLRKEVGQRG